MSDEEIAGTVPVTETQYLALQRACKGKCFDDLSSVVQYALWSFCKRHDALDGQEVREKGLWFRGEFDEFASTCLQGNAKFSMTGGYLYKLYTAWCQSLDRARVTPRMFAVEAGRRFAKKRTSQGMMYQSIRPNPGCDLLSVKYSTGYVRSHPKIPDTPVDLPAAPADRPTKFYPALPLEESAESAEKSSPPRKPGRPAVHPSPRAENPVDDSTDGPDLRRLPGKLWPEALAYQRAQEEKSRQSANGSHSGDPSNPPDDAVS